MTIARPWHGIALTLGLAVPLLLAGCGDDGGTSQPVVYQQPNYGYLTKLRLNVAQVAIDDNWVPTVRPGQPQHVESLSPVAPVAALRQMAQDRLLTGGSSGSARFTIEDASILRGASDRLDGSFAVRLDIDTSDGQRAGFAEARVVRSMTLGGATDGGRATAYALVKQMMDDMNVEFEYQVRHSLGEYLQSTDPIAAPTPVQSQDLGSPGSPPPLSATPVAVPDPSAVTAPTGLAPSQPMSPPPSNLQPPATTAPYRSTPGPTPLAP